MADDTKKRSGIARLSAGMLTSDLRGRQSVRATFKLTEGCIDAISIVATHLGIKQKSLFDHLIEDPQVLSNLAREIAHAKFKERRRVQKTYVISRKSLYSLDEISKHTNTPRDRLIEMSVQRLLPIITKEQQKHETRKKLLAEIQNHFRQGQNLLANMQKLLGADDPICQRYETAMSTFDHSRHFIESFIDRGRIIEGFHLGSVTHTIPISEE